MQIVSIGDNLHEMSNPVSLKKKKKKKKKKIPKMSSAENFTQSAKCFYKTMPRNRANSSHLRKIFDF